MNFLIADTFTDSLARLTGDEQKAVKTTAFDLQIDATAPGLGFHKLDRAKDKRFWSVRGEPHEIGVFVRSSDQAPRATAVVESAALSPRALDERVDLRPGSVNVATMHLAKGLEFRIVAVMACDDEILPVQARIEGVGDDGDLQEVYDTERQLLYVACTRARDRLSISGVEPASEFLDDLKSA